MRLGPIASSILVLALCVPAFADREPSRAASDDARKTYARSLRRLSARRTQLRRRYLAARTKAERGRILDEGSTLLFRVLAEEILPAWVGTPWSFSGTSGHPGEGAIACGTFVGTVLLDSGFRLDRIAMGRLASEHIASSLAGRRAIHRYRNRPVGEVEAELVAWGPGLYMVGLDYHAGLAVVDEARVVHFVHSSSYDGGIGVIWEPLEGDNPFAHSKYRVLARLLDRGMTQKWLLGQKLEARAE